MKRPTKVSAGGWKLPPSAANAGAMASTAPTMAIAPRILLHCMIVLLF